VYVNEIPPLPVDEKPTSCFINTYDLDFYLRVSLPLRISFFSYLMANNIPNFPGQIVRKAPAPPKFLVTKKETESGTVVNQVIQVSGIPPVGRPRGCSDNSIPVASTLAQKLPEREYNNPPHNYPKIDFVAESKKALRNSKYDTKPLPVRSTEIQLIGNEGGGFPDTPKLPAIPKPFIPAPAKSFSDGPMLHVRTGNGVILGSRTKLYVPTEHVPLLVEVPLGPDNPFKELNQEWTACWDDQAGAIYYYNKVSGEATWIAPNLIRNK
jgi:hypothetical protein